MPDGRQKSEILVAASQQSCSEMRIKIRNSIQKDQRQIKIKETPERVSFYAAGKTNIEKI